MRMYVGGAPYMDDFPATAAHIILITTADNNLQPSRYCAIKGFLPWHGHGSVSSP